MTILLAAGLLVVVLSGCATMSLAGTRKEAPPASPATSSPPAQVAVPPIDAVATRAVDIETATFALG
ncbi:MAG: hypothetical protein PVG11_03470 [Anaerolineae bacterium]